MSGRKPWRPQVPKPRGPGGSPRARRSLGASTVAFGEPEYLKATIACVCGASFRRSLEDPSLHFDLGCPNCPETYAALVFEGTVTQFQELGRAPEEVFPILARKARFIPGEPEWVIPDHWRVPESRLGQLWCRFWLWIIDRITAAGRR